MKTTHSTKLLLAATATALLTPLLVMQAGAGGNHAQDTTGSLTIQVAPATIVLDRPVTWVTVHAEIPFGVVVRETVALNGLAPKLVFADSRGELVAKFDYDEVSEIIAPPNALLELTGYTVDGEAFSGGSTVTVR